MCSEPAKLPEDGEFISDYRPRSVSVKHTQSATLITVSCSVKGSLGFIRAGKNGQCSWLIRLFRLQPPEPFSDGLVVFGLCGTMLDALKNDQEMADAVGALLKSGTRLSLQRNQLVATVRKSRDTATVQALSSFLREVAIRIEKLIGESANDAIDIDRLGRPYILFSTLAGVVFGLCIGFVKPSLAPLTIALYSFAAAIALAVMVFVFALPMHLRRNALGGAIVRDATISAILGPLMLGASFAMIANTYFGERLVIPRDIRITGTVGVTHGKYVSCWLALDHPSPNLVRGELVAQLPVACSEVHYHANPEPSLYDVKLNPGLLGAPFVESAQPLPPQYASKTMAAEIVRRVEAHLVWHEPYTRLATTISVRCREDGKQLSASIVQSSGNPAWDTAALAAVKSADPMPTDGNGKSLEYFKVIVHPELR